MPRPTLSDGSRAALASSAHRTLLKLLKDERPWGDGTWFLARNLLDGVIALQEVAGHAPTTLHLRLLRDVQARLDATRGHPPRPRRARAAPRRRARAPGVPLNWVDDRAESADGSTYLLASEKGLHEPRTWWVMIYRPGDLRPTEELGTGGALRKREARALAERDAREREGR